MTVSWAGRPPRRGVTPGTDTAGRAIRGCLDIGVEQHGVAVACLSQGAVVATGVAQVLVEGQEPDLREVAAQQLSRPVGRAVVGHYHVGDVGVGVGHDRWEELAEELLSVPVEYDDSYRFHWCQAFCPFISNVTGCFHRLCDQSHREGSWRMFSSSRRA